MQNLLVPVIFDTVLINDAMIPTIQVYAVNWSVRIGNRTPRLL